MKKSALGVFTLTGILLLCSPLSIQAAAGQRVDSQGDFESGYWDEGEYISDGIVFVPTEDTAYPAGNNIFRITGGSRSIKWSALTTEQKMHYLATETEVDCDALAWWVSTAFDDNTKFNYFNSVVSTCTQSSMWVINSTIDMEQKIQYFRNHDLRHNSKEVHQWWFENVGNKLTTEQTERTDANNYAWYMRTATMRADNIEIVNVGDNKYYISTSDLQSALQEGKITYVERTKYWFGTDPWTFKVYSARGKFLNPTFE